MLTCTAMLGISDICVIHEQNLQSFDFIIVLYIWNVGCAISQSFLGSIHQTEERRVIVLNFNMVSSSLVIRALFAGLRNLYLTGFTELQGGENDLLLLSSYLAPTAYLPNDHSPQSTKIIPRNISVAP